MYAGDVILVAEYRIFWHELYDLLEFQHRLETVLCGYGATGTQYFGLDIWWTVPEIHLIDILVNRYTLVVFLDQRVLNDHSAYFRRILNHTIFYLCIPVYVPITLYRMNR